MLQAYFDESENQDVFVVSGYVATVEQWAAFTEQWKEALARLNGGKPFKMSTLNQEKPRDIRDKKIDEYADIINENTMFGVTVAVYPKLLNEILKGYVDDNLCEPYYFAYWIAISILLKHKRYLLNGESVEFIFDAGRRESLIDRNLDSFFEAGPQESRDQLTGRPRFATDDDELPLQAADMRAWWARRRIDEKVHGYPRRTGPAAFQSPRTGVNLICTDDFLYEYRDTAIQNRLLPTVDVDSAGNIKFDNGRVIIRRASVTDPEDEGN